MTTAPPRPPAPHEGPADGGVAPQSPREPVVPAVQRGHRLRYAVVGLVLVGSLAFLVAKGLGTALNFYLPADQAVAQEATLGGKTINLEGVVAPGSIHPTASGVDFVVTAGSTKLDVQNTGSPPELFQADIPVIAVGHFDGSTFVSDQILVKHSSTYIAAHPNRVTAPNGTKR